MTVTDRMYNHSHGSWDSYHADIEPVEDVKDGVRKLINDSLIYKHRLINDLASCCYYDEKVADILLNVIIEHCTEDELKYILSTLENTKKKITIILSVPACIGKNLLKMMSKHEARS